MILVDLSDSAFLVATGDLESMGSFVAAFFPVLFPAIELILNMWIMEQHVVSALILLQCAASPAVIMAHSLLLLIDDYMNDAEVYCT